jgi:hypothetical protein
MNAKQPLKDPTNRVVSVFDKRSQAESALQALVEDGFDKEEIRLFHGAEDAANVDTSPKWFADTDVEIKKYRRELDAGNSVISVPIDSGVSRERVHAILQENEARLTTHFGEWITEVMQ